jgi:hypothetical protein
VVNFIAGRRARSSRASCPTRLLLSGSLRAGYSLLQGVEAVSKEVADPMGQELRRVITEARLGREIEESMDAVAERMSSPDFAWAVMAIRIQREVGGNLAELLMTVADTMVHRERLRRDVNSLTAEGRMSAIILALLPIGLGLFMWPRTPSTCLPSGTPAWARPARSGHRQRNRRLHLDEEDHHDRDLRITVLPLAILLLGAGIGVVIFVLGSSAEEKATVRASLRQLEGYEVDNVRDQELLKPVRDRTVAPVVNALSGFGKRFTPDGYMEKVPSRFLASGNRNQDTVDRFIAMQGVGLIALVPVVWSSWCTGPWP